MKTWKLFLVILTMAMVLAFGFISCDDNNTTKKPVECTCEVNHGQKNHLGIDENCECGADVNVCTEQVADLDGIQIRKVAGVTVAQMNTIVGHFNTLLTPGALNDVTIANFKDNVTAIHIGLTESGISLEGKTLKVGADEDYMSIGMYVFANYLGQVNSRNGIRLANGKKVIIDYSLVIAHDNAKKDLGRAAAQKQAGLAI